jgi:hypothetical protein
MDFIQWMGAGVIVAFLWVGFTPSHWNNYPISDLPTGMIYVSYLFSLSSLVLVSIGFLKFINYLKGEDEI